MPREFKNLVMTNIRRIAHTPGEAECIARLLFMQVILVCVAHAAQKSRACRGTAGGCDPSGAGVPEDTDGPVPAGFGTFDDGSGGRSGALPRPLWELMAGVRGEHTPPPPVTFFCGRHRVPHLPWN